MSTVTHGDVSFVRQAPVAALPPPVSETGVIGWLRKNLFFSPLNFVLTALSLGLILWVIPPLLDFLIFNATWSGQDREACVATAERPEVGACWAFVRERISYFIYGFYPISQRWRVDVFFALLAVGTGYMLLARWLLPKRSGEHSDDDYLRLDRYRTELRVAKDGRWSTRPLAELQKALGERFRLRGWLRDGKRRDDLTASSPLLAGDILLVEAAADELLSLHNDPGLDLDAIARFGARLDGEGEAQLVQAVVAPGSEFIGRSLRELDFARQFHAVIAGLWRRGDADAGRMSDARLREGDLLVLYGRPSRFSDLAAHHGFLLLVPFAGEAKRRLRAPLALAILGLTILAAATEWLPAPLAFLLGAVAMVVTRCVDIEQAYRGIDVRIFVMIAGVIPLGIAMEQTGTADLLAHGLSNLVASWPPLAILLVVFGVAALLTQVMSDAATTALLGPVAIALAQMLDLPPTPFVACTALGAVVAFLTPIGHHGNLLILGPGQYRFGDFLRIGLPLTALVALVSAWMARWLWLDGPLFPHFG